MGPHTITGWISFVAVMASSAVTGTTAVKMTFTWQKRRRGDPYDVATVVAFGTLTMLGALLFWFAETR